MFCIIVFMMTKYHMPSGGILAAGQMNWNQLKTFLKLRLQPWFP